MHSIFATAALRTTEDAVAAPLILFPIQITNWFRIEPAVGVFRHSHDEPADYSVNGVELGLGIFPQLVQRASDCITGLV